MNKKCKSCLVEKEITDFYIAKKGKYGRSSRCKSCMKAESNKPKQIDMARKRRDKYYQKNKEIQKERAKELYIKNREKISKRAKLWKEKNKERFCEVKEKYMKNNKDKINEYHRNYQKKLRNNPHYRIKKNMSYAIWRGLNGGKFGKHWENLIPYNVKDLISHIESKFTKGMTWDNYGKNGWHIDHIIPQSYFKYDSYDHPDFRACWALSNLQPLWATTKIAIDYGEDSGYIGNLDKRNKFY